jgi:hypothetical protein
MRGLVAATILSVVAAATLTAAAPASRRNAELLKQKVAVIQQRAMMDGSAEPVRVLVTEDEVNSYLVFEAADAIPVGVVDPTIAILGTGRVSVRAVVDIDQVNKARKATGLFDPLSYLTGKMPIEASGTITTGRGVGQFQLERASLGGVTVPKMVLQEVISYYSRSPEYPAGFGLDDPFELPARIQEILVLRGQAIIVQ